MAKPTLFERMSAMAKQQAARKMELFTAIDDGIAIIQKPKGVCKQVKLYHRDGKVYIAEAGGYIQVRRKWGNDPHGTAHPDIKVLDLEGKGLVFSELEAPAYRPQGWAKS